MFRTISQTAVDYRGSALSAGRAGGVHGGDRLPWVEPSPGRRDNFAPLTSLDWQVHVYGDARPDLQEACAQLGSRCIVSSGSRRWRAAGFERDALYLIRPDGYVAWADADADPVNCEAISIETGSHESGAFLACTASREVPTSSRRSRPR